MVKQLISLRLETTKLNRLRNIALTNDINYTDLIRDKIDEILNGHDIEVLEKVIIIVKELREPFIYFKTGQGKKHAIREKEKREKIASIIERAFSLKGA